MSPRTQLSLPPAQRRALSAIVVAGFLSGVFAFSLLLHLLSRVRQMRRQRKNILPITVFYLAVLFWDVIQAIGCMANLRWILQGEIMMGDFCATQALIKQLGNTGGALSIVGMSWCILHDYVIDSMDNLQPRTGIIGLGMISFIQVIVIALPNGLFHGAHKYYGISGYWCWISSDHFTTKIVTEYLWFWLAAVCSLFTAVAYYVRVRHAAPLPAGFLWIGFPVRMNKLLRLGLFSIDSSDPGHHGRLKWSFSLFDVTSPRRTIRVMLPVPFQYFEMELSRWGDVDPNFDDLTPSNTRVDGVTAVGVNPQTTMTLTSGSAPASPAVDQNHANGAPYEEALHDHGTRFADPVRLLLFPLSYILLIAPLSIVRFIAFRISSMPFEASIFVGFFYALAGLVDVVLFYWAKPAFGVSI